MTSGTESSTHMVERVLTTTITPHPLRPGVFSHHFSDKIINHHTTYGDEIGNLHECWLLAL